MSEFFERRGLRQRLAGALSPSAFNYLNRQDELEQQRILQQQALEERRAYESAQQVEKQKRDAEQKRIAAEQARKVKAFESILTSGNPDAAEVAFAKFPELAAQSGANTPDELKALIKREKPPAPTVQNEIILPIMRAIVDGKELSASQQKALDVYQRTGVIDQLFRQMGGGLGGDFTPQTSSNPEEDKLLQQAREAIAKGKSRKAVEQVLRERNIDPGKL